MMVIVRYTLWLAVCLSVLGCGKPKANYDMVDLVEAHGTVTLDGQPLAGAVVTFEDIADDTMSYGQTDAQGHYELQFDSDMSGVKVGSKVVRISTTKKILGLNARAGGENEADGPPKSKQEQVPAKYNTKSELKAEVNQSKLVYDFELDTM